MTAEKGACRKRKWSKTGSLSLVWNNNSPFNKSAHSASSLQKNYQNRFMCIEVIVCYIIVVFLRHSLLLNQQSQREQSLTLVLRLRPAWRWWRLSWRRNASLKCWMSYLTLLVLVLMLLPKTSIVRSFLARGRIGCLLLTIKGGLLCIRSTCELSKFVTLKPKWMKMMKEFRPLLRANRRRS